MKSERTNWTTSLFRERMSVVNPNIEIHGEYKNTATKIHCRCRICMFEWDPVPNSLLHGSGCPQCAKAQRSRSRKISQEEFLNRAHERNSRVKILGDYKNTKSKIECYCLDCGNIWFPTAGRILSGHRCPKCSYNLRGERSKMTQEEFEAKLVKLNPYIKIDGTYDGAYSKIDCHCLVCGYKWKAIPHHLLTRGGCQNCCRTGTSYVEQMILRAFSLACGEDKVLSRDRTIIGKELDIYIPYLHLAIEPGAWIFHKDKVAKDKEKIELCKTKDIELFVIYYLCTDNIEGLDTNNITVFSEDLATETSFPTLKKQIYTLFSKANIDRRFSPDEWEAIKHYAYLKSRRLTTEEFKQKLFSINPNIEFLGEYTSSQKISKCQCKICGHIWNTNPNRLLQGVGCPNCWNLRRGQSLIYSHEYFVQKLHTINPNITVLEPYTKGNIKIKCNCNQCNYEWKVIPSSLLQGSGCPKCGGNLKPTTEEFILRMAEINPNIEITGEYINTDSPINCLCKICNYTWATRPHDLLTGHSCPECANKTKRTARRMSQEEFEKNLSLVNPQITVIGKYSNNHTKIECECNLCGNIWFVVPNSILSGRGCPVCAKKKRGMSHTYTHEYFVQRLQAINPDITVMEPYTKGNIKVKCSCNKCGYQWSVKPANLLQGTGCPKCKGNLKPTTEEFISRMAKINPSIEITGSYTATDIPIGCCCKNCNHVWSARPHELLNGRGCPKCANQRKGSTQRMTQEQFEAKLSLVNPQITVIGKYSNNHTKIECECNQCSIRWFVVPKNLLNGHGCPICAKEKRRDARLKNRV